jgi:signal transduction histidine kinase
MAAPLEGVDPADLRRLPLFDGLSDEQVAALADAGAIVAVEPGVVLFGEGEPAESWWVLLDGTIALVRRIGREDTVVAQMDVAGRWAGGFRAWDENGTYLATGRGDRPGRVFRLPAEVLRDRFAEWFPFGAHLIGGVYHTARSIESTARQRSSLITLGTLAAGLAHELNNPASAVMRSSKLLLESLTGAEEASRILASANLSQSQFAAIDQARAMCDAARGNAPRTPIERADREDELTDWLADHRATQEFAIPLADTGITPGALDLLAKTVTGDALEAALGWISATVLVKSLAGEIERAAERIHELVAAVKGFSYMDHAPAAEPVDIRRGIADTLTMLNSKSRAKGITVGVEIADDVPRVYAVGAELNQVWMNLIDNAIDAVGKGGHVTVAAERDRTGVLVRVTDDGPGVPPEIQGRIFDPFFTTKGVGEGTGLGLDIVRRLLQRHDGDISLDSKPGHTEFQVRLRAEQ